MEIISELYGANIFSDEISSRLSLIKDSESNIPVFSDIDTYTGIDTIQLLILETNLQIINPYIFNFRYDRKSRALILAKDDLRIIKRRFDTACYYYTIQFSVSSILHGINLSSNTPIYYEKLIKILDRKFEKLGFRITNWKDVKTSRVDTFRNLILKIDYDEYFELFRALNFLKSGTENKNTIYYKNKETEACIYDKSEQMNIKSIENILRVEFRAFKTRKAKKLFKSFNPNFKNDDLAYLFHLENFDADSYFISQSKKMFKHLINFSFIPQTDNLKDEIKKYHSKKRNSENKANLSLKLIDAHKGKYFEQFLIENFDEIVKPSKRSGSSKSRNYRIRNQAKELLIIGLAIEGCIKHGDGFIRDLIDGLCNPRDRLN
ncbi:hypothetical protein [Leptospira barantonii]|uniref:Uncharacterized protein n=1 Tax=Leptospira barantonii TaxID=2023184 RepID=A0ABX4NN75_9LEPT|nr:hypothetical protein [Leptospira barantonii]PJZ58279.1 hypothetical protein CH367_07830 [Leptospira barantonii]